MRIFKFFIFVAVSLFGLFLIANNFNYVGASTAVLLALGIFATQSSSLIYRKYVYALIFFVTAVSCFFHYQIILSACPDRNVVHDIGHGKIPAVPCIEGPEGTELYGLNLNLEYLLALINALFVSFVVSFGIGIIVSIVKKNKNEEGKFLDTFIPIFAIIFSIYAIIIILFADLRPFNGILSSNTWLTSGFVARGKVPIASLQNLQ